MNHVQKIISKLPLIDLNGLEWTIDPQATFIQSHLFEVQCGSYTLEVDAYLEMIDERIYIVPTWINVFDDDGQNIIDLNDREYEILAMAINDNI